MPAVVPVDGHVHFHHRRFVARTLDAALHNFRHVAGRSHGLIGLLLLTQASAEHVFEELETRQPIDGWFLRSVAQEKETLIAQKEDASIAIVCGRQVRAESGLEVLALGTRRQFADGASLADTICAVRESGALAVLPWGFGKWLGQRARRVESTLAASAGGQLFVGDNGSRLAALGVPALIRDSGQRGLRILPGTDPFPFCNDFRRVGSFGFLADVSHIDECPWGFVREWLLARKQSPMAFGHASGPIRFVLNQVGIQFYNHFVRSSAR
jgi:hypothetical protein